MDSRTADERDRAFYLVGAQPKNPDEGLSVGDDDEEESVASQMRKNKSGQSDDEGNLSDVDQDLLKGMEEGDESETKDSTKDETDESEDASAQEDEEEATYRKRFADTKADRDEKARQLRQTMEENARLRALNTIDADVNEEELARQIQEGIFADISRINEKDPERARRAAYDVVGKHIAKATKQAVGLALRQVKTSEEQQRQQESQVSQAREMATKRARLVLKEEGLNPDKHFSMFQEEVDKQMEQDPDWFEAIPPNQHYVRLVNRVKERIAANKKANDDHQREAQGQVNSGSRFKQRQPQASDQDDDANDTLRGAMALSRKANFIRGRRAFGLTSQR